MITPEQVLSKVKDLNEDYIKNKLHCEKCGAELTMKEIDRGLNLCEGCDGDCHCSQCEESK